MKKKYQKVDLNVVEKTNSDEDMTSKPPKALPGTSCNKPKRTSCNTPRPAKGIKAPPRALLPKK